MTKSLNLTLSIFSLIFTSMLVFASHLEYDIAHNFIGVILEMVTIPIILMTIALLVYNAIKWTKEKWSIKNSSFYALIVLVMSVGIMVMATIHSL